MGSPSNGIYILQREITLVVTAMRRSSRWSAYSQRDEDGDPLLSSFAQLKDVLNNITGNVYIYQFYSFFHLY
ncbi:hypothetical protein DPMN_181978 [Dreissena polymorpha]|uniref:Uncharacterized protein n=1 Tax=Dreissena polymorpha TaxID=45954 RepID=A0A9D4I261_DREPO|nr:hypothetical protein DPMN_181978 [Dreissena polymorpha]